jgi:phosphohistidine phosphatase
MMKIYLVRHGAAYANEEDPERHLNNDGLNQCHLTGRALKRLDIRFDLIVSSPKVRARQTAEIIAEEVGYSGKEIKITETLQPTTDPKDTISFLNNLTDMKRVLLAGHLPLLENLASELLNKSSEISLHFETGTVCLIEIEQPISYAGDFHWFLAPEHIKLLAYI